MKLLRFKLVNPSNPEQDTTMAIDPKHIGMVQEASPVERRSRPELSSLIHTPYGCFGVREKLEDITARIEEGVLG